MSAARKGPWTRSRAMRRAPSVTGMAETSAMGQRAAEVNERTARSTGSVESVTLYVQSVLNGAVRIERSAPP